MYYRGENQICTWYGIDESGSRKLGTSFRPPSIQPKAWVKMTEEQKLEAIAKHSSTKAGVVIECAPLGVAGLRDTAIAAQVSKWPEHKPPHEDEVGLENYCIKPQPDHPPELAPVDQLPPDEYWDKCIDDEKHQKQACAAAFRVALAAVPDAVSGEAGLTSNSISKGTEC